MPITFHCPYCNARYVEVTDELLGRTARCRRCSGRFRIQPEMGLPLPPKRDSEKGDAPAGDSPKETPPHEEEPPPSPTVVLGDDEEEETKSGGATTRMADDEAAESDEPEAAETVVADVSETVVADVSETVVADISETVVADVSETVVADVSETVVADVSETVVADVSETVVADVSETVVADVSETVVEKSLFDDDAPTIASTGAPLFDPNDPNIDKMIATVSGGTQAGEASVPAEWSEGDSILGLYDVLGTLGEGGMGKVYKVLHRGWNVELAVKSPKPEELERAGGAATFVRESETWVNLGLHPHTVSCYYVRSLGGIPRVFAEYVDGGSLSDWIAEGKLTEQARILDVLIQFAWGLSYAHERGLVHQDVKPANVMMTVNGAAKVTDFGLAKARGSSLEKGGTVAFGGMTPAYCSPEQAEKAPLTHKTDMWSFGVSALEIYIGELTWMNGVAARDALLAYLADETDDSGRPRMPKKVADVLKDILQLDPASRPTDMIEVADRLQEVYREVTGENYPRPYPKVSRDTAAALNNRAISLLDLGRGREAMSLWAEALDNEPHHPEATFNYGMTLWRLGRITDSALVGLMEEVVKSHGRDSSAPCYLGLVHQERDDLPAMADALSMVDDESDVKALADTTTEASVERGSTARRATKTFPVEKGGMTSLALSGDGALLLTGDDNHRATLWDTATGKRRFTMGHGPRSVTSVALSGNGTLMATGGYRSVILWDGASGTITGELPGHDDWVSALTCSADGTKLLSLCWDGSVRLWETAHPDMPLWSHEGGAGYAVMTPDARFALFGSIDATVRLVDLDRFDTLATFDTPPGPMALSADAAVAIVADTEGEILVFDPRRPDAPQRILSGIRSPVASVALSHDGRLAATGAYDKSVRLWDVATGRCLRTFEEHSDTPSAVAFGEGGKALYSAGWDATAIRWELAIDAGPKRAPLMISRIVASEKALTAGVAYEQGLTRMRSALEQGDTITAVQNLKNARSQPGFSREAEALAAWGALYRRLPRAGLRGGWETFALPGHGGGVTSVAVSSDGRRALTGSHDRTARIWDLDSRETVTTLTGSSGRITSATFDASGSRVLTASADGALRLWDAEEGTTLATLLGHTGAVNAADLSADGRIGVSVGADIVVRVWGVPQAILARSLRGHAAPANAVRIDPSGRLALTGGDDRTARLWDLANGVTLRVLSGHRGKINGVDLTSDTRRALTVSDDGSLIVWDLETAQPIKTMRGGDTPMLSVAVSFDGRYALTGDAERAVRLWDIERGIDLRLFDTGGSAVEGVAFAPDLRYALSAGADGFVRHWTLDFELEEQAEQAWDDRALLYLDRFLGLHTPPLGELPEGRSPFEKEIFRTIAREGGAVYSEDDVDTLMATLCDAGFGWLTRAGVVGKLNERAKGWYGPVMPVTVFDTPDAEEDESEAETVVGADDGEVDHHRSGGLTGWMRSLTSKK